MSQILSDAVDTLLAEAEKHPEIAEVEAYASRNEITMARLETLRRGTRKIGPAPQQLKSIVATEASVRVVVNRAIGSFATNYFTKQSLKDAIANALANAKMMQPDPNFHSLAKPVERKPLNIPYDKDIMAGDISKPLVDEAEAAVALIDEPDIDLAGSVMTVLEEFSIGNSNGIEVHGNIDTFAVAQLTSERVDGAEVISSGMGWDSCRHISRLSCEKAASDALELARLRPKIKSVAPGDYNVILGPYAVADILENMLSSDFCLDSIYSGSSWLPTEDGKTDDGRPLRMPKLDTEIADSGLTVRDDPSDESGMSSKAYDDEGLPTRPTVLIENGIWKGVLADSYYSYLYKREPGGNGFRTGTMPGRIAGSDPAANGTNFIVEPGEMTLEELIEVTPGPALMIPRTWYTYPTRMGGVGFSSSNRSTSYIIQKGELVPVAPNAFKLSGNIATMLKSVHGIGRETKSATTWAASVSTVVPHMSTSGLRVEKSEGP